MYNSGQQNQTDQTANFFWLIVLVFGAVFAFWWFDQKDIVASVFWFRTQEIGLMRWLLTYWVPIANALHLASPNADRLQKIQTFMQTADPAHITWDNFAAVNVFMGQWIRYPVIVILLTLAAISYFRGSSHFHHVYNMQTLRKVAQEVWPEISPVMSLDLVKTNIETGPWAMAKMPLAFCREHDILATTVMHGSKVWAVKQKAAYRLITLQIGPLWKGLDALPIHIKALALIFLARATGQRPLANKILRQISASATGGQLNFAGVSDNLKQFYQHRIVQWLEKRHAYMTTVMASLLEISRSDGVLATAEFLWLKPVDRRLWYVLNTVGRQSAVVEVAGSFSHWQAEKKVGRALKTPMIKGAVDALEESLQNILHVEAGDQWRTTNAD